MNDVRGYIFSRSFMGERVPQHIQNQIIRNYCTQNQLEFLLSSTEYAMENCYLMLDQVLDNLDKISGVVAYSLFQLPESQGRRKEIYKQFLSEKKARSKFSDCRHMTKTLAFHPACRLSTILDT